MIERTRVKKLRQPHWCTICVCHAQFTTFVLMNVRLKMLIISESLVVIAQTVAYSLFSIDMKLPLNAACNK